MLPLVQWINDLPFFTAIRESALVYPILLSTHLAGIGVFGGMILMTDLRLLGVAMTSRPVSEVYGQLRYWKWLGFVVVVTCGTLLGFSKLAVYYPNPYFRVKMLLLALVAVHALVFRRDVYGNTAALDQARALPAKARLAAATSICLWIGVVTMGRMIGYWE
jgi:hypothetical protein